MRSGYGAVADEWIGIRPGTDGLFAFALIHELLRADRIDLDYLVRFTNAHWLVIDDRGGADDGLFARDEAGAPLCWDRITGAAARRQSASTSRPPWSATSRLPDGRRARPVFHLVAERYLDPQYAPDAVSERCGIPADTIRRIARELAAAAFDSELSLPIAWTDTHGRAHARMVGRPVAMHAMRGISAHSNGFHTCRALHLLQLLLGAVDAPGSFRYQPPFPRPIPPGNRPGKTRDAERPARRAAARFHPWARRPAGGRAGQPRRIDHAYSWAYPLAVHGMLHTVIRNAWAGDPTPVDVLFLFMANMSWNSAMNTARDHALADRQGRQRRVPHPEDHLLGRLLQRDGRLRRPGAARHDLPGTLRRGLACSTGRSPMPTAPPTRSAIRCCRRTPRVGRDVRGFQSVLLDLGARLRTAGACSTTTARRATATTPTTSSTTNAHPASACSPAGAASTARRKARARRTRTQLERYIANGGFWRSEDAARRRRYFKMANRDYLQWSATMGFMPNADAGRAAAVFGDAAEIPPGRAGPRPRAAAGTANASASPPTSIRCRSGTSRSRARRPSVADFPLSAVTQRPPFMYHAWGSQNAWLRQIATRNFLYLHPDTAAKHGLADDDWVHLDSHHGRITVPVRLAGNVQPDTVWTWNAIGKRRGAWKLAANAPEATQGFLLNHLISDITPRGDYANADPVTGQAAWFDLRVRLEKVSAQEPSQPQFAALAGEPADNAPLRYGANFRNQR